MSTIYKIKSSATRAAKAQFGEDWKNSCTIIEVEGGFSIQTEKVIEVAPQSLAAALGSAEVLVAHEEDTAKKDAKKKELMAGKPQHIPALPAGIIVASQPAPSPIPALPAALAAPSQLDAEVPTGPTTQADADKLADAQAVNVDPARPRMSTTDRPTKKVWDIADKMPNAKRKEVIEACVAAGIAYGTARTQYQHWFKCKADSAATPIATIDKDGKIVPPAAK